MTYKEYHSYFESILQKDLSEQEAPYDNPDYLDYTKLNFSRMNRWFKTGKMQETLLQTLAGITAPQQWIVITEPWCGDAAHNIPFIEMAAASNPNITVSYVLRDTEPTIIDQYLTNGTKSIPKLIVRDAQGNDLTTWGPRPAACQTVYTSLLQEKADFSRVKLEIQNWYNANKGVDVQEELRQVFSKLTVPSAS
ncbi:MAG: thioredoxin family protein [Sphingobacteriales bacterium]|nr:MAG: thioredoxin family protein [Sphingobacteriales bacterium]